MAEQSHIKLEGLSPNRKKRRDIVLLRGMLLVAVGSLLLASGRTDIFAPLVLLIGFALTDLLLLFTPLRVVCSSRFEITMGAADIVLVSLGIYLAGAGSGALPISCFLMVLVVAVGNYRGQTMAAAAAVGALHSWLVLGRGTDSISGSQLGLQIIFLCAVALYYGYLVGNIHFIRRRMEDSRLEKREQQAMFKILNAITSSLDLKCVGHTIVTQISRVIPMARCSLLFINEGKTRCFVMASDDDPNMQMLEIDLERYPEVRQAIETRNPVLIRDVSTDPLMARVREVLEDLDVHSIAIIPLNFAEDVLGTLCLKTARGGESFSRGELDFCMAVAQASANALKNALLHRQVQDAAIRHQRTGEKLTSILDHSPDLILTTDLMGQITEFNRGAERLLGYPRDEALNEPCTLLFVDDRDVDIVKRIREAGALNNYSLQLQKKDGSEIDLQTNMSTLRNEAGDVTGTVWLGRDVTELKSAQMQLLQAKKLSSIGEVISGVAHELNNPLSGVLGYSQLLMMRNPDSPMIREIERINDSAMRCQKIVKNLLSFSRAHRPERKYLGVNGILKKTLDLREYQLQVNNIEVVSDLDPELPRTMVDFHQMQQVFLNLINNAQHSMSPAGQRRGRLLLRSSCSGGVIQIEFTDNGRGMSPQTLERIFDPFFTTKAPGQGTGLGLSVSYGIINEHGGRIFAHSEEGKGTTFFIELPVRKDAGVQEVKTSTSTPASTSVTSRGGRVLIVDDEAVIVNLLLDVLGASGYQVDTATNGNEAKRKIQSTDYDLVISDIRMPQMNGMELYREIRESRPDMSDRVIFSTGDLVDRETVRFLEETNCRAISKPFQIDEILAVVAEVLEGNTTSAPV